jgi:hypothetical protein
MSQKLFYPLSLSIMSDTICHVDLDFDTDMDTASEFHVYLRSGIDTDSLFEEHLLGCRLIEVTAVDSNDVEEFAENKRLKIRSMGFGWVKKLGAAISPERLLTGLRGLDKTISQHLKVRHYRGFSFCK